MTSSLKTSLSLNSYLILGSLFVAHLFIFPLLYSSVPPSINLLPKSLSFEDNVDEREAAVIDSIKGIEVEDENSSFLLAHLTDDENENFHSELYVARTTYLNVTELEESENNEKRSSPNPDVEGRSPEPDVFPSFADPALVPRAIYSLKLQGKQHFAVDDFVNHVDITDVINDRRNWAKRGANDLGIDEAAADGSGDSSDASGSGTEVYDASGDEQSGSGDDGDPSGGASGGSDGASGNYGNTSGDYDQSGSGGDRDACGGDSSGMDNASGAYGDTSGDCEPGSGSKKGKGNGKCCNVQ